MNDFVELVILVLATAGLYVLGLGAVVWATYTITDKIFGRKDVPKDPYWYLGIKSKDPQG